MSDAQIYALCLTGAIGLTLILAWLVHKDNEWWRRDQERRAALDRDAREHLRRLL